MKPHPKDERAEPKACGTERSNATEGKRDSSKESAQRLLRYEAQILRDLQKRADEMIKQSGRRDHWTSASS